MKKPSLLLLVMAIVFGTDIFGISVFGISAQAEDAYSLRYKLKKGETYRWKVTHLSSSETTILGETQTAKARTVSVKSWRVTGVDDKGNATLIHVVDEVEMWQKVTGRPELRWNSKSKDTPPLLFQPVAETIGKPMYESTINAIGHVTKHESKYRQTQNSQIGLEQMTIPLPRKAITVGTKWHYPGELRTQLPDGRVKRVKIRRSYQLTKVHAGVATIKGKTEVLTPIHEPKVKLDLLQRLNAGTIKFDIDAGIVLSKQFDWDETIVRFNGAESIMEYLARFTEEYVPANRVASRSN